MNKWILWLGAVLAFGVLNWAILDREQILAEGEVAYLELAPRDPRSLLQGDYMVLRYDLARKLDRKNLSPVSGRLVIRLDENRVGHFVRYDDDTALADDERYLAYKHRHGARFGIESFFFQEGEGERYAEAKYAKILLSESGQAMLVDLVVEPGDAVKDSEQTSPNL